MGSRRLELTKHHGAGNDFLVLLDPDGRRPVSGAEARALCDRRRGVGADGLIRALAGLRPGGLAMELRNADGTEAEMSGNGIRCLVQAAVDAGLAAPGTVEVHTLGGPRWVQYTPGDEPGLGYGRVGMGTAALSPDVDPGALDGLPVGVRWCARVDMGNPHLVVFGASADDTDVRGTGPVLGGTVAGGANVEFVWPGPGVDELTLRVWERGVGETLACGTGTCAAVAATLAHGDTGPRVRVHNPGGPLDVTIGSDGVIVLAGPTRVVASVVVDEEVLATLVRAHGGVPLDAGHPDGVGGVAPHEVASRS